MKNKIAILIFAHSADFEAVQKPFKSSAVLFDALNTKTLRVVEKSGLPYFHSSEKNQIGSTFGERFTNAIQSVYNKGFDTVITIGNDTPHLQTKHLLKAKSQLQQNNIVLGPAKDGGFYLMGLKKSFFNIETFLNLPWQTSQLRYCISKLIQLKGIGVSYLETLSDIDTISDVTNITNSFRNISKYLKQLLQAIISIEKKTNYTLFNLTSIYNQNTHFNKGSPVLLLF